MAPKTSKLVWMVAVLALSLPAFAVSQGSISGTIKNSSGTPQMGAAVEIYANGSAPFTIFTDDRGRYSAAALLPGTYQVKVSAPSFLPSLRENVALRAGANLIVNITLNTLFEAIQLVPLRGRSQDDDDGWKWTLRSVANRPILRLRDEGPLVVSTSQNERDSVLKARVSFVAGSDAEGFRSGADRSTAFVVEKSIFSTGMLAFDGALGYASNGPAVIRASYKHQLSDGRAPEIALTMRRFTGVVGAGQREALSALALTLADNMTVGNLLEFSYGGEYQAIQFMGRVAAFRPFGTADLHLGRNTVLEYGYSTSQAPGSSRLEKGFVSAPADLSESGPRVSLVDFTPKLERARHQELSLSRRFRHANVQAAVYSDRVSNTALVGVGSLESEGGSGDFLPDLYSESFTYNGGTLAARGVRLLVESKLASSVTATLSYSYGGVLGVEGSNVNISELPAAIEAEQRHALAAKLTGRVPGAKTRWMTSYKWINRPALTPVDMFNTSPGQSDPYFNVFIRQPLPGSSFLPGQMEALIDVRNLLAQGYIPVVGSDGHTVYLVQSARSIRGGLAFNF